LNKLNTQIKRVADTLASGVRADEFFRIAILFTVVIWIVWAINLSSPGRLDRAGQLKGADFLQFYVMGHLATEHAPDVLYDPAAYAAATRRLVPEAVEFFPPVYPPQVSVLFQPLAALPYGWAVAVWWVVCVVLYGGACFVVWRNCGRLQPHGRLVGVLAVGSPAFFNLIAHGQSSAVALALFVALFVGLLHGYRLLAGVALGLLIYKPQLGLAAGVVFLFSLDWPVVVGAALAALAELAIGWWHYGGAASVGYLEVLSNPTGLAMIVEQKLHHTHSLRTWWAFLIPWRPVALVVYGVSAVWVLGRLVVFWRSPAELRLRYSALLLATVLVSPHVFVYDLVVIAPALFILADWSMALEDRPSRSLIRILLLAAILTPVLGPLATVTRLQLSVPVIFALFVVTTGQRAGPTGSGNVSSSSLLSRTSG
jgi:hypothetical protein